MKHFTEPHGVCSICMEAKLLMPSGRVEPHLLNTTVIPPARCQGSGHFPLDPALLAEEVWAANTGPKNVDAVDLVHEARRRQQRDTPSTST